MCLFWPFLEVLMVFLPLNKNPLGRRLVVSKRRTEPRIGPSCTARRDESNGDNEDVQKYSEIWENENRKLNGKYWKTSSRIMTLLEVSDYKLSGGPGHLSWASAARPGWSSYSLGLRGGRQRSWGLAYTMIYAGV